MITLGRSRYHSNFDFKMKCCDAAQRYRSPRNLRTVDSVLPAAIDQLCAQVLPCLHQFLAVLGLF